MILFVALIGTFAGVSAFTDPAKWDGKDEIKVLTDTVNDLTIIVNNLDAALETAQSNLDTANADLATAQSDLATALALNGTDATEIDSLKNNIDTLEGTISTLNSTIGVNNGAASTGLYLEIYTAGTDLAAEHALLVAEQNETERLEGELLLANKAASDAIDTICVSLTTLPLEYKMDFAARCSGTDNFLPDNYVFDVAGLISALDGIPAYDDTTIIVLVNGNYELPSTIEITGWPILDGQSQDGVTITNSGAGPIFSMTGMGNTMFIYGITLIGDGPVIVMDDSALALGNVTINTTPIITSADIGTLIVLDGTVTVDYNGNWGPYEVYVDGALQPE